MLNIHRIQHLYQVEGTEASRKALENRQRHVTHLHKHLKRQRIETNRRDYRLQELNNYGKMLFYAHLGASKSLLVKHSYLVTSSGLGNVADDTTPQLGGDGSIWVMNMLNGETYRYVF